VVTGNANHAPALTALSPTQARQLAVLLLRAAEPFEAGTRVTSQSAPVAHTVNEAAQAVGQHPASIRRAVPAARPETIPLLSAEKLDGGLLSEVDELRR